MNRGPTLPTRPVSSRLERFDHLIDQVSAGLDDLHGIRRSRRFWAILTHRYLRKCLLLDEEGYLPEAPPPSPPSHDETILGPRVGELAAGPVAPTVRNRPSLLDRLRRRLVPARPHRSRTPEAEVLERLERSSIAESRSILFGFHQAHVVGDLVPQPAHTLSPPSLPAGEAGDCELRERLREIASDVESPLVRRALEWLPTWYVEEFGPRERLVAGRLPDGTGLHASFQPTVEGRMFIAHHAEEGAPFTMYQHAGTYGEILEDDAYHIETFFADRFRTWGWTLGPKDVPFVAHRLMVPEGARAPRHPVAGRSLYVNVRDPFPWFLETTLDNQERFFARLDPARAGSMVLRPRTLKGGSSAAQVCERAGRSVMAVDSGAMPWLDVAREAELVVVDGFPTTLMFECLTSGIPVVAIVEPQVAFTPIADPFYDEFFRAGILHRSPESAADFLNHTEIEPWWDSVRRTEWLAQYLRVFCNMDPSRVPGL